ncbi:MAG: glycosyltransferase family 4 protein [Tissierellia bacterium]|nr:glycosyltransferase family 4 protein [Tissierellia bacterium]
MKKVWIINHYGDPPDVGRYRRHAIFAKKLAQRGYDVKMFTASTIHTTDINFINDKTPYLIKNYDGVEYVFIRTNSYKGNGIDRVKNMINYYLRVQKVAKKFGKCDVIYSSSPHSLTWLAAEHITNRLKVPHIAETRDLWPKTFVAMGKMKENSIPARILYKIEKHIYKNADRLIFTMPGGKDYVKSLGGIDLNKVKYINNGIDIEEFNKNIKENKFSDEDLEREDIFKVVFTGSIGKSNNLKRVIDSFKIIQDKGYKDIKLLVYGDGADREPLIEYAKENNIENVVFKGRVEKKYVPYILSKADLQLLSVIHCPELYQYGMSPNKLFEYFAAGKPTISNVECNYDLLEKYNSGKTIDELTNEKFADGIIEFYNLPKEDYNRYCENALKASKDFDFDLLTDKLEETINEVLS